MPGLTLTEKSKATTSMRFSRVLGSKYKDSASHMHCLNWSTGSYYVVSVCVWQEQYRGLELILKKCLGLLKALARGNDFVQLRMFERLDILLKIKVVESDVAIALKEVPRLSFNICCIVK